jgi:phenylacetate-coenzyme A ligase PaaK-like adenylate-forming protein
VVERKGIMDEMSLKVEPEQEIGEEAMAALMKRISERLKMKTNLRFLIRPVKPGALPRYTLKSKRFKDLREMEGGETS